FDLKGGSKAGGELFFTTDSKTTLPKGNRVAFDVTAKGDWQEIDIELKTDKAIQQLRIDVSEGPGNASIRQLRLIDKAGQVLIEWLN
ncbi:MAG: arylsulfatase, partial [Planctomycetota bacterium]|nr:arylsulfatase [Planctomycetota bacterium]